MQPAALSSGSLPPPPRLLPSFPSASVEFLLCAGPCSGSETPGMDVDAEFETLTSDQQALVKDVLGQLASWTGLELERATHNERPWQLARIGYDAAQPCHEIISKEETARFYKRDIA